MIAAYYSIAELSCTIHELIQRAYMNLMILTLTDLLVGVDAGMRSAARASASGFRIRGSGGGATSAPDTTPNM